MTNVPTANMTISAANDTTSTHSLHLLIPIPLPAHDRSGAVGESQDQQESDDDRDPGEQQPVMVHGRRNRPIFMVPSRATVDTASPTARITDPAWSSSS